MVLTSIAIAFPPLFREIGATAPRSWRCCIAEPRRNVPLQTWMLALSSEVHPGCVRRHIIKRERHGYCRVLAQGCNDISDSGMTKCFQCKIIEALRNPA